MPTSPLENRAYIEFVEFFVSRPTLAEITAFRYSDPTQARIAALQDARKHSRLTEDETAELTEYLHLERLVTLLKMRALEKINNTTRIE